MAQRTFEFKVVLTGTGRTVEDAWNRATDAFNAEPGPVPDDAKEVEPDDPDDGS